MKGRHHKAGKRRAYNFADQSDALSAGEEEDEDARAKEKKRKAALAVEGGRPRVNLGKRGRRRKYDVGGQLAPVNLQDIIKAQPPAFMGKGPPPPPNVPQTDSTAQLMAGVKLLNDTGVFDGMKQAKKDREQDAQQDQEEDTVTHNCDHLPLENVRQIYRMLLRLHDRFRLSAIWLDR